MLGKDRDPKVVWDNLEQEFGVRQEGLQELLVNKLQRAAWDSKGSILTHRDTMYNLRAQLLNSGLALTNQSFHHYFLNSLPPTLDQFVMFYDNLSFNVDTLCQCFVRWEARRDLHGDKFDKLEGSSSGGSLVLFGQQSSVSKGKERQKRDLSDVTCYECGEKGHV